MSDGLLLTGGTGFLGMCLLARLLERDDDREIVLLARDRSRVDAMLAALYERPPAAVDRLRVVGGDLALPGLGMGAADRRVLRGVRDVAHCAASISVTLPLDAARAITVEGTRRVLDLVRDLPHLRRVVHVSTAYVAGRASGWFREDDAGGRGSFRNTYEQTKCEAEQALAASGVPTTVVRPSIVVGESGSGWTPAFNVLYWPLQALARGLVRELPAEPGGVVDVVPVDHVVDVLEAALADDAPGGTFHATLGDAAPSVAELLAVSAAAVGRPAPPLVPPARDDHPAGVFAPYFDVRCRFDERRTREQLGLEAPPVPSFYDAVVGYAVRTRWGRRPLTREAARAVAVA